MSSSRTFNLLSIKRWIAQPATPDELMVRYATQGDAETLAQLYDQCADTLYYYLLVLTEPDHAADIAQKTWLKVIEQRHAYRSQNKFEAWLFTLGRHILLDEIRKNRKVEINNVLVADYEQPADTHVVLSDAVDFHSALKQLPFAQREAFSLQQEGFSLVQIAHICHTPVETIKTRLRYARQSLKIALEKQA